jgi:hypothetical protein
LSAATTGPPGDAVAAPSAEQRRPSLSKHVDRAIERLSAIGGRLDLSDGFRDVASDVVDALAAIREDARRARGDARDALLARLPDLDRRLLRAARAERSGDLERLRTEAAAELEPFRSRLSEEAWLRSVDLSLDRLLRDQLGLPTLEVI